MTTLTKVMRTIGVALAFFVLAPCSVASADFFNRDTIQRFAPLLVMYAQEDNGPSSAPWFLDHSDLAFAERAPCASETVYAGPWTASATRRLGLLVPSQSRWQYQTKETLLCHHSGPVLLATDHTRPYNSNRPPNLHENEGFFLDANLDKGAIGGMPFTQASNHEFVTQAPVYYDDGELFYENGSRKSPRRAYISYWFFYPFNDSPRARFLFNHQGDWENLSLLFLRGADRIWRLEEVSYSAHGAPEPIDASCPAPPAGDPLDCPAPRTAWAGQSRLVGFVANGSHATYPSPGPHSIKTAHGLATDLTSSIASGFSWPTWQNLLPLEAQGWAGFCGAWGRVGKLYLPFRSERTGPLGPGCLDEVERQRKRGGPRSWGVSKSSPGDRAATPGQAIGVDQLGGA